MRLRLAILAAAVTALLALDAPVPAAAANRADAEQGIRACANRERSAAGLSRLQASPQLAKAARMHARNMARQDFFSHTDPQGRGPLERLRVFDRQGRFRMVGENIAAGYGSAASACKGWMKSQGHRANILRRSYTHVGGGFSSGGSMGRYYVQVFAAR